MDTATPENGLMNELIARIDAEVGVPADKAETAIRIILNFLATDGPADKVEALAERLGALDYLGGTPAKGGLLGRIGGLFGGGGAMAAFGALTGAGLGMGEIQGVVKTFIAFAREKVGREAVDEIVASIPGLSQFT